MGLKQGYFSTRSVSQLISLYGWADSYANTWITSTILYVDMKKGFLKGPALWEHPSRLPRWAERWHKVRGQFYIQLMPSFHHFRKHYLKYHLQHHASHSSKATLPGGCHKKKSSLLQEVQTLNQSAITCARNCSWGHMILETLSPAWLWQMLCKEGLREISTHFLRSIRKPKSHEIFRKKVNPVLQDCLSPTIDWSRQHCSVSSKRSL